VLIAQISDTHVCAPGRLLNDTIDTAGFLARAVAHLNALDPRPALVLATGDLANAGQPAEYAHLRALLAPLALPVYLLPGNHDAREALVAAFPDHAYLPRQGFLQYVVEGHPVRLLALDTLTPGEEGGRICDERRAWLAARLGEAPQRPTVVAMHHPPFATGLACMDEMGFAGAEALAELVRRHPQVEGVLCGHLHRPIQTRWAGTIASTAPSTAHQVTLDLRDDGPLAFSMEPPACQLHLWRAGAGLVSHVSYIGAYDGPHVVRARPARSGAR
jgi:3',5'-cyclic AMP phosphodiesterase CpdA